MTPRSDKRPDGALERAILAELWNAPGPQSPREVQQSLVDDLAYTTVMTILSRLFHKGLVDREVRGRGFAYLPRISEADLIARRLHEALSVADDRAAALSSFVGGLTATERAAIESALDEARRRP